MPYLTCQGFACMRGRLTLPRIGPWVADLVLDPTSASGSPPTVGQQVTLSLNGALSLQGTIRRSQNAFNTVYARVIAGGAGFPTAVPARAYSSTQVGQVLSDLMGDAGETLSPQSSGPLLSTTLGAWVRPAATATQAMTAIAAEVAASWRILPDGSTWVGSETWPAGTMTYTLLSYEPQELKMVLYSDAPTILPGQVMPGGGYVSVVEHIVEPGRQRMHVYLEDPQLMKLAGGWGSDRLKLDLENFIKAVLPSFDFYALSPGTVTAPGSGANRFDFQPDNQTLPGLQNILLRTEPGVTATMDPASNPRCLLGFEGGDPSAPYLALWSSGSPLTWKLAAETSINLSAPVVALGPAWTTFLSQVATAVPSGAETGLVQVVAAAVTLLTQVQAVQ